jgi:hypothetical protein
VLTVVCVLHTAADGFASDKVGVTLSVADAVTTPGRPVRLEAKLLRSGGLIETGIGGEQLEFLVAGRKIGTAMTGGDGRAYLEYTPKMRGNQTVLVRVIPSKRVEAAEGTATVASWEKRRPILLVEQSALLEERPAGPVPGLPLLEAPDPSPAPGAAEELKRLAEFYFNVMYLQRTGETVSDGLKLRDWSSRHGFPFGLRVTAKPTIRGIGEAIEELRGQGWDSIKAGVGRSRDFAEALIDHRLRVVVIGGAADPDLPKKAEKAKDWRDARKLLQR